MVRKIPEGYVIIEMYSTSRNERHKPVSGGLLTNGEIYWPVKLKYWSEIKVQGIIPNGCIYTVMSA